MTEHVEDHNEVVEDETFCEVVVLVVSIDQTLTYLKRLRSSKNSSPSMSGCVVLCGVDDDTLTVNFIIWRYQLW